MSECSLFFQLLKWLSQAAGHGTLQCCSSNRALHFPEEPTKAQRGKWLPEDAHTLGRTGLEPKVAGSRQGSTLPSIESSTVLGC